MASTSSALVRSVSAALVALAALCGCRGAKTPDAERPAPAGPEVEGTHAEVLENGARVVWLGDVDGDKLNPRSLFPEAPDSLFEALGLSDGVPSSMSAFLAEVDGEKVLFDAGLGAPAGRALARLEALGVSPDEIRTIYLTHFHADHVGGLVARDGNGAPSKVFRNAAVWACRAERDAWMNDIPDNALQKTVVELYGDSLRLFEYGDVLPHGVTALDAAGHTPGHAAFRLSNLLVAGDLMHGYALQKDHPEYNSGYDMDGPKSAESRARLLRLARENGLLVAGMHFPAPGFARP